VAPYLSGQRALQRDLLRDLSDLDLTRFGVEVALHRYMEENKIPVALVKPAGPLTFNERREARSLERACGKR